MSRFPRRGAAVMLALWCAAAVGCRSVDPWSDIDDPEMEWRAKAAAALALIEADEPERLSEAVALLEGRWNNDGRGEQVALVRFAIVDALGRLGTERAAPIAAEGLSDPDALVRAAAAHALGRLGAVAHRPVLIARLAQDDAAEVRAAIATALADIEDPDGRPSLDAVPALIARLDDTAIVSVGAHAALQRLTLQPLERDPAAWREWWTEWNRAERDAAAAGDRKK